MARLRACLELKEAATDIEESQPQWETDDEPWYFKTVLQKKIRRGLLSARSRLRLRTSNERIQSRRGPLPTLNLTVPFLLRTSSGIPSPKHSLNKGVGLTFSVRENS